MPLEKIKNNFDLFDNKSSKKFDIKFTGERLIPGNPELAHLYQEHIIRYMYASQFVKSKVVLDAGCSSGFFSIKLIENDARKVIGIDQGEQNKVVEQARFATNEMGIQNIEYKTLSVYDVEELDTKFDFTLFLGILYHLRYPLLALDKLRKVTDKMIIQTITTKIEDPHKKNFEYLYRPPRLDSISLRSDVFYKPGYPKIHFIENKLDGDISNKSLPNVEGVTSMLRASGFKIEKILLLDHEVIAVCS